jgi:hypothetical protein
MSPKRWYLPNPEDGDSMFLRNADIYPTGLHGVTTQKTNNNFGLSVRIFGALPFSDVVKSGVPQGVPL